MSDSESDNEIVENVKQPLKSAVRSKERKPMTEERLSQLAQMRERAKIIAQAKKELKADNPSVKDYKRRDPVLMDKVAEIENRSAKKTPAVPSPKVTKPLTMEVAEQPETVDAVPKQVKKPKNKRIVYVSESDSSSEEEEVVIKKPKAKKTYQWTPEDIEDLKQKEIEMRMKKWEEQNEFARMENAMLKKQYDAKVKEVQKAQLAKFMFGGN